jgi:cytochrome c biogenesis protein CcmG/thiol:disulfide interchange protein DsbE
VDATDDTAARGEDTAGRGEDIAAALVAEQADVERAAGSGSTIEVVERRSRLAPKIVVPVALVLALLVVLLATRDAGNERATKSPLVGKPAPPIVGTTVDGERFDLADLQGRWVVVNFFATWCTPCVVEHPELIKFAEAHKATDDVRIVSVAFADQASKVREFFAKNGGDWAVLAEDTDGVSVAYGVTGVPESLLVDPRGRVVAKLIGGIRADDLEQQLAKASGVSAAPAPSSVVSAR